MNEEYKQWKKWLAHPISLLIFGCCLFFGIYAVISIVLNGVAILLDQLSVVMSKDFTTFKANILAGLNWKLLLPNNYFSISPLIYLAGFVVFLYRGIPKVYQMRISYKDINKGTKGTERLTTLAEIKEQYKEVPMNDEEYEGESGVPVIRIGDNVYIDTSRTNSGTIGSSQSGKTEMFSYPLLDLIMRAKIKDSVLVTDLKGDMLRKTKPEFERFGYDVYCLNLIEPEHGIRYNPLAIIWKSYAKKDYSKAQLYANAFSFSIFHNPNAKDPTWEEASIALLNALILMVCEIAEEQNKPEYVNLYAVTSILEELGGMEKDEEGEEYSPLDEYFYSLPARSVARKQYATVRFSKAVTRSGILMGTMGKLKNYTYDSIATLTAENDLDFEEIAYGEKPVAIFLVYPDWSDANYTILSTFLYQFSSVLAEKATLSATSTLPRQVRLLLEEIFNMPAIQGLSRQMNVSLQRGIIHHLVYQSNVQGDEVYGKELAKGIRGACGNQYFIMSDEDDDAKDFSEKLGDKTIITLDRHGDPMDLDKSYGEKEDGRRLFTSNELMNLKPGEWVVYRTKKRRDLKGNKITAYPIFASIDEGTEMKHAYEYLAHRFKSDKTLAELGLGKDHLPIDLDTIVPTRTTVGEKENLQLVAKEVTPVKGEEIMQETTLGNALTEEETTPIEEALSQDKYYRLTRLVQSKCTPQETEIFKGFTTIEEIKDFLSSGTREDLRLKAMTIIE